MVQRIATSLWHHETVAVHLRLHFIRPATSKPPLKLVKLAGIMRILSFFLCLREIIWIFPRWSPESGPVILKTGKLGT